MFNLTDLAALKIKELSKKMGMSDPILRVRVIGGGCSGMRYDLGFSEGAPRDGDKVFEYNGAKVYIDEKSLVFITGSELDYNDALIGPGFKVKNPNANSTCGCGDSFGA